MTRVFQKGSQAQILARLGQFFVGLPRVVHDGENYDQLHADFCEWFIQNISTAERKRHGKIAPAGKSSYGQAAKVLNISAKVYVCYCGQPSNDIAQAIVPMLHAALDNKMVRRLARRVPKAGINVDSLTEIDRAKYEKLRLLLGAEIQEDFDSKICPVEYDDIIFRRVNRLPAAGSTER